MTDERIGPDTAAGPSAPPPAAAGATPRRTARVSFVGGTSHSRASVDVRGTEREVVDRTGPDGETPPPAGCPCSSGF
ncbi:hypothetical protein [Nocardioides zeae]|uniref:Uncharacterized protein n=1 Tax=Nocardioides zeae TaxID=1457234 RepID=A0A6P0HGI9_9ACTN|nr:hypothetical protein [Nocardioides zeae]NEN77802.1 hypothetical protein [Nocardioides zeae]